jgi:hypothetical protein
MPNPELLFEVTITLSIPYYAGLITRVNRWASPQVRDGP